MRVLATVLVVLAAIAIAGCELPLATSSTTLTQSSPHMAGTTLDVQGVNGTITVIADTEREDVHVTAEVTAGGASAERARQRLDDTVLSVQRDTSRTLTITTDFPSPTSPSDKSNLTVRVPDAASVQITTSNGRVEVHSLDAPLTVQTTNGRIVLQNTAGDATLTTVNGRIESERHAGTITASTTNGRVTLTDHDGQADVNTTNGRITVALAEDQPGPVDLRSTNGRITLTIGEGFAGTLSMRTNNGSLTVDDAGAIARSQTIDRRSGTIVLREDGEPSTLRAGNGRITVTTR